MSKGLFVAFEGVDGCGKSTCVKLVDEKLNALGFNTLTTREPGGTEVAEKIRNIILNEDILPETEALLFAAGRVEHTLKKIKPAIDEGKIVLCDRYLGSSLAYQGYARGLGFYNIERINDFGIHDFRPDLQFFIDVKPEDCFKRMGDRAKDRLEQESLNFFNKAYMYFKLGTRNDEQVIIDGYLAEEQVADLCIKSILEKMKELYE